MKVAVDRLKEDQEMVLKEDIPVSSWDMNSSDLKFTDLSVECSFLKLRQEVLVRADIQVEREIVCSRCLDKVSQSNEYTFQRSYNTNDLKDYLDIDQDIREDVLLKFPMKVLCKKDCKGICSSCGANLNHEACNCKNKRTVRNS